MFKAYGSLLFNIPRPRILLIMLDVHHEPYKWKKNLKFLVGEFDPTIEGDLDLLWFLRFRRAFIGNEVRDILCIRVESDVASREVEWSLGQSRTWSSRVVEARRGTLTCEGISNCVRSFVDEPSLPPSMSENG